MKQSNYKQMIIIEEGTHLVEEYLLRMGKFTLLHA